MKRQIREYLRRNLEIDDIETTGMLLENYRQTLSDSLKSIRQAIGERDAETLRRAGHSLKGCSATIGAEAIREVAAQLETAGRSSDFSAAEAALQTLLALYAAFTAED